MHEIFASCRNRKMLNEEQWIWLQEEISTSDAQVHIIVSSVQVLTTNPVVESWGHFPEERDRLLRLVNELPGLILISGDVHHAEISNALSGVYRQRQRQQRTQGIVEVTSSGLTHSCIKPFYGPICAPILRAFPTNRFHGETSKNEGRDKKALSIVSNGEYFYTGRNYGTIAITWAEDDSQLDAGSVTVNVHNIAGRVVLSTGAMAIGTLGTMGTKRLTNDELSRVRGCIDGHLRPLFEKLVLVVMLLFFLSTVWSRNRRCCARNILVANKEKDI